MKKCDSTLPGALPTVHHWATAERPSPLHPMLTNTCINRAAALVLLLAVYAVGYDNAKQEAAQARHNHPAAYLPLKP